MKGYNGHKSRAHWNASLWLNNDEHMYLTMLGCLKDYGVKDGAVNLFGCLKGMWKWNNEKSTLKTPDGDTVTVKILEDILRDEESGR